MKDEDTLMHKAVPTVWLYWDSPQGGDPGYISLCRQAIELHAKPFPVVVLSSENIHDHVDGIHEKFNEIPQIAHKADYARAACLAQNGGIWLDIDTVPLAPLSVIWSLVPSSGAVFYGWRTREPSIGMIAAESHHPLLTNWRNGIEKKLDDQTDHRWSGVGYDILWPLAKQHSYTHLARETCAPLHYTQTGVLSSSIDPAEVLFPETVMIQLYNRGLSAEMGRMDSAEIMQSNTLLRRLLDMSFASNYDGTMVYRKMLEHVSPAAAAIRPFLKSDWMYDGRRLFASAIDILRPPSN